MFHPDTLSLANSAADTARSGYLAISEGRAAEGAELLRQAATGMARAAATTEDLREIAYYGQCALEYINAATRAEY